ncbi:MAG: hypothetical protein NC432_10905 [Roseburia sp.]|nr:hypothetical protein [Roseburia sp.]MCM1099221.1 hypothetical protein [Ruminococcus flavefaciens]
MCRLIGKLSLFISRRERLGAGVTVEASIVLPLCLFFLMNLSSAVEMIRLHNNLQIALWDTGGRLALYGYELGETEPASWLSGIYVRNRVVDYTGKEYLDNSPLVKGSASLQLWESEMLEGDSLDIKLTYSVGPIIPVVGFRSFRMANRYSVHLWNGYDLSGGKEEAQLVYLAENGSVCHKDRNCTYLRLSISPISQEEVSRARNQWGRAYNPCEKCAKGQMPDILYITGEGTHFHYSGGCSGLKRTVYAVSREEAAGYPDCSRCGG